MKLSPHCTFSPHKDDTVLKQVGGVLLGSLSTPVGIAKSIAAWNPSSSDVTVSSRAVDLPTGSAVEVAALYTCPDDVQSLNNGAGIVVTRNMPVDYHLAKDLADQWNQEPALADHLRGAVPKNIVAARGSSYWELATTYYSSGRYWIGIAQANHWKLIYPGETVDLPPMQKLLFGPCYVRARDSIWVAAKRLNVPPNALSVANTTLVPRPAGCDSVYPLEFLIHGGQQGCAH